jgi:hypothetical protein
MVLSLSWLEARAGTARLPDNVLADTATESGAWTGIAPRRFQESLDYSKKLIDLLLRKMAEKRLTPESTPMATSSPACPVNP